MKLVNMIHRLRWLPLVGAISSCAHPYGIDSPRGCEDLILFQSGGTRANPQLLTASRKTGEILQYQRRSKTRKHFHPLAIEDLPENLDFRPLALDVFPHHPSSAACQTLYTLSVGKPAAIVSFIRKPGRTSLVYQKHINLPKIRGTYNSMAVVSEKTILVSVMGFNPFVKVGQARIAPPDTPLQADSLISLNTDTRQVRTEVIGLAGANGISLTQDRQGAVVAQYYGKCLAFLRRQNDQWQVINPGTPKQLQIHPDNIKSVTPNHFELAGQYHWISAMWATFMGLPVSGGDSLDFSWTSSSPPPSLVGRSRKDYHRGDFRCPSTALTFEGYLFVAHSTPRSMLRVPLEPPSKAVDQDGIGLRPTSSSYPSSKKAINP